ncbi:hypothetical protein [Actinomycetospora cinnamomea]|uniref:hypothetical protein n=1 Tax=Actinomycetospora cinnamomea TaxID=663609 RepID=UPI000E32341A|nr:hypothetical protein [Actinomycetospora cinnamomea]
MPGTVPEVDARVQISGPGCATRRSSIGNATDTGTGTSRVVVAPGSGSSLLELLERVVDLVRRHAPQAAIAFNTGPDDRVDAAQRWLGAR